MSAYDWEEIKRLAADFQRVQLSSSSQKLSERNCIEIVQRLIDLKLVDLLYTTDGKEYITPLELTKEILEELTVAGGRVNLVDVQTALNVNFSHIETRVNDLVKSDKRYQLILGQLIDKSYFDRLSDEINSKLQEEGNLTLAELAKTYSLPGDILREVLENKLGNIIQGYLDESSTNLYTKNFIDRHAAKIRGLVLSLTRPTNLSPIINKFGFQERMFFSLLDKLIAEGHVLGSILGSRPYNASFVPEIYTRSQNNWVDAFYNQNSYLEYDALTRLGISDPQIFIRKRLKNEKLDFLKSCCLGPNFKDRLESEIEEALSGTEKETGSVINLLPLLPTICCVEDVQIVFQSLLKADGNQNKDMLLIGDTYVTNQSFLNSTVKTFDMLIKAKATKTIENNPSILLLSSRPQQVQLKKEERPVALSAISNQESDDKKEQKKKKSAGGGGTGNQGREPKTKSAISKKKLNKKKDDDGDDEDYNEREKNADFHKLTNKQANLNQQVFLSIKEVVKVLSDSIAYKEASEEFIEACAGKIIGSLNKIYNESLKSIYIETMNNQHQMGKAGDESLVGIVKKKNLQSELTDKICNLWLHCHLYEKSISLFKDDVQVLLKTHLIKTHGTELTNYVFALYAIEYLVPTNQEPSLLSLEDRNKVLEQVKDEKCRTILFKLNNSLASKNLEDFFENFENICNSTYLNIPLKRDKKKERQMIYAHRLAIKEELNRETDPARILHLSCVYIFHTYAQNPLHIMSGKLVPHIIPFFKQYLNDDKYSLLIEYQDLILKSLKTSSDSGELQEDIANIIRDLIPKLKNLALQSKTCKQNEGSNVIENFESRD